MPIRKIGSMLMIGPVCLDAEQLGEPAPLEHRDDRAEGGRDGEQEAERSP